MLDWNYYRWKRYHFIAIITLENTFQDISAQKNTFCKTGFNNYKNRAMKIFWQNGYYNDFSLGISNQIEKIYTSLYTTFCSVKETHKCSIDGNILNKRQDIKYIGKTYIDDE